MKSIDIFLLCGCLTSASTLADDAILTITNTRPVANQSASVSGNNKSPTTQLVAGTVAQTSASLSNNLRLNFRGAPLSAVLDYLSEAAGLIIVQEIPVEGTVEVWSDSPASVDEAVSALNTSLAKRGFAALRRGRVLFIANRTDALKRDIPVRLGNDPETVAKTPDMVTQIIPVRYANATQMTQDLRPLLPSFASLTANESGNALVLTDAQTDVRRMLEIVRALDTSIASLTTIRIIPLQQADAKELADIIKELFPAPNTSSQNSATGNGNPSPMVFAGGLFGAGPGGLPGGDPGSGSPDPTGVGGGQSNSQTASGTGQSEARRAASRVTVVADERTNSLVVSAPDELLATIELLIKEIDRHATQVTELRVFHLQNADPDEMAEVLGNLFPDTTQSDNNRSSIQFGGGPMGPQPGMAMTSDSTSQRSQQKGRVLSVPDARTASLVVSAARDLMPQIEKIVTDLDANPAHKQKVFIYALQNAGVANVQQVLRDMFQSQSASNTGTDQTTDPLLARQNQNSQSSPQQTLSFGSSTGGSSGGSRQGSGGNLP